MLGPLMMISALKTGSWTTYSTWFHRHLERATVDAAAGNETQFGSVVLTPSQQSRTRGDTQQPK